MNFITLQVHNLLHYIDFDLRAFKGNVIIVEKNSNNGSSIITKVGLTLLSYILIVINEIDKLTFNHSIDHKLCSKISNCK
jgi:hypothetical protein